MFFAGLDLGQRRDHSAIAIVEKGRCLALRHVERVPLGTPYPAVVERVRKIMAVPALNGRCALAVDSTGVGAPVVDMLRRGRLCGELYAVTITGGEKEHRSGSDWSVPKRDLIAGLQVLLDRGQLKIARGLREMEVLVRELMDMRAGSGGRMGAERAGEHDDLVIALALACWHAGKGSTPFGFGTRRLIGF